MKKKIEKNIWKKKFVKDFYIFSFFQQISIIMDSAICLLLKVDSIAYISGNFGL